MTNVRPASSGALCDLVAYRKSEIIPDSKIFQAVPFWLDIGSKYLCIWRAGKNTSEL